MIKIFIALILFLFILLIAYDYCIKTYCFIFSLHFLNSNGIPYSRTFVFKGSKKKYITLKGKGDIFNKDIIEITSDEIESYAINKRTYIINDLFA